MKVVVILAVLLFQHAEAKQPMHVGADKQVKEWAKTFVPKYRNMDSFDKNRVYISPMHARWIKPSKPPLIAMKD